MPSARVSASVRNYRLRKYLKYNSSQIWHGCIWNCLLIHLFLPRNFGEQYWITFHQVKNGAGFEPGIFGCHLNAIQKVPGWNPDHGVFTLSEKLFNLAS